MKKMIIGIVLMVSGAMLGLYVGVWICFVGGIVDVIAQIRTEHLSAFGVAIGVSKVVLAGLFGWLSAIILIIPGYGLILMSDSN